MSYYITSTISGDEYSILMLNFNLRFPHTYLIPGLRCVPADWNKFLYPDPKTLDKSHKTQDHYAILEGNILFKYEKYL